MKSNSPILRRLLWPATDFERRRAITVLLLNCFIASAAFAEAPPRNAPEMVADLEQLTGAATRVVWVQDQSESNRDTIALGTELQLVGFDSQEGRSERIILGEAGNYCKPLFTPDGRRVVFSDRYSKDFHVVDWNGANRRRLGAGFAVEVWRDPQTQETWVYFCSQVGKLNSINFKTLRRIKLDGGGKPEVVWDKSDISPDNFQLSASGTLAAAEFPWPNGGTLDLAKRISRKRADGCWASLAPDDSGLCWVFDGPHRNVYLYPRRSAAAIKVPLNTPPGFSNAEVFHPRWSNHVRYLTMTGPYKIATELNTIAGGGPEVEVFVGRFAADFHSVEAWTQVSHNQRGDFLPDVWIEGGEKSAIPGDVLPTDAADEAKADQWPESSDKLLFVWDNASAQNVVSSPNGEQRVCRLEARGKAKYGCWFDLDCTGGSFIAEEFVGPELVAACRRSNEFTMEVALTPLRDEQTGPARIITSSTNPSFRNFQLSQDKDALVFELTTDAGVSTKSKLTKLATRRLMHVVLSFAQGKLCCWIDGSEVVVAEKFGDQLGGWINHPLIFGDELNGKFNWAGKLEAIALYSRALSAEEATRHYGLFAARLDHRLPPERIKVRAKCLETTPTPHPNTIVPYRRALVLHRYRVEKVLQGTCDSSEILVAQWGILDKKTMPDANPKVGQVVELFLEQFDDHPELRAERQVVEIESLELPWYYAVGK